MRVLDMFSAKGNATKAFKDRGHNVTTIDNNPKFKPDICQDIMGLTSKTLRTKFSQFNFIWASPPCDKFSMMSVGRWWSPIKKETREAIRLVLHTLDLIEELEPEYWILENPMGMLRRVIGNPNYHITQCQYGRKHMKPTDLWGKLPESWIPKRCKNRMSCHIPAPRGSRTGIQGKLSKEDRSKIPYGLSLSICEAIEKATKQELCLK